MEPHTWIPHWSLVFRMYLLFNGNYFQCWTDGQVLEWSGFFAAKLPTSNKCERKHQLRTCMRETWSSIVQVLLMVLPFCHYDNDIVHALTDLGFTIRILVLGCTSVRITLNNPPGQDTLTVILSASDPRPKWVVISLWPRKWVSEPTSFVWRQTTSLLMNHRHTTKKAPPFSTGGCAHPPLPPYLTIWSPIKFWNYKFIDELAQKSLPNLFGGFSENNFEIWKNWQNFAKTFQFLWKTFSNPHVQYTFTTIL